MYRLPRCLTLVSTKHAWTWWLEHRHFYSRSHKWVSVRTAVESCTVFCNIILWLWHLCTRLFSFFKARVTTFKLVKSLIFEYLQMCRIFHLQNNTNCSKIAEMIACKFPVNIISDILSLIIIISTIFQEKKCQSQLKEVNKEMKYYSLYMQMGRNIVPFWSIFA